MRRHYAINRGYSDIAATQNFSFMEPRECYKFSNMSLYDKYAVNVITHCCSQKVFSCSSVINTKYRENGRKREKKI